MQMFQTLSRTMEPNATLKIECVACGHQTEWSRRQAFERLGPDSTPADVSRQLKCGRCDERKRIRAWI